VGKNLNARTGFQEKGKGEPLLGEHPIKTELIKIQLGREKKMERKESVP